MKPDADFATLPLPAVLDGSAAVPLAAALLSLRGRAVSIDATRVERLGALCLQVLVSARITWAADGIALHVDCPSPAFDEAVTLFGARSNT